ncbi:MAG: hypothetical protein ABL999_07950 [Pyrinomonadaceae bacterium]
MAQDKPKLAVADLEKHTYYFEIADNKLEGAGARFLTDEIKQSQFVLLGEYHGSMRIAEFTKAAIPVFSAAGCRTFALEIGPVSGEILSRLSTNPDQAVSKLKTFNSKYAVVGKNRTFTPIPFFGGVEDADFLTESRKEGWRLLGLDQEGSFAYVPLVDEMYANLGAKKQAEIKALYEQVTRSLSDFYLAGIADGKGHYKTILDSKAFNQFLTLTEEGSPKNKKIADAIRFTSEIFYMNDNNVRKYYEANSDRIQYMKRSLAEGFRKLRFDTRKDRMLVKMGAVHTGRGFSPLSLFEVGNTLSEIAAFNGNRSLHIEFGARYFIEDGKETDALADEKGFLYRYQAFLQMAKNDQWTVIDLRPLRKTVFYQRKFDLDPIIHEIFKNHDLYIMPPKDRDATPNYTLKP